MEKTPSTDNLPNFGLETIFEEEEPGSPQPRRPRSSTLGPQSLKGYDDSGKLRVKLILLGDSFVGKSKLIERFLINTYTPSEQSTYALLVYRYDTQVDGKDVIVELWDTAGQEQFSDLHPSYYTSAHACILVFDCTRKATYKNLERWIQELKQYRPQIPCLLAGSKVEVEPSVMDKPLGLAERHKLPTFFVSGAEGTNVIKLFNEAIEAAVKYAVNPTDVVDQILVEASKDEKVEKDAPKSDPIDPNATKEEVAAMVVDKALENYMKEQADGTLYKRKRNLAQMFDQD